jgi:hypothetical protein
MLTNYFIRLSKQEIEETLDIENMNYQIEVQLRENMELNLQSPRAAQDYNAALSAE